MKKKIIFYLKADNGLQYGYGHFFRCLLLKKKIEETYGNLDIKFLINKNIYVRRFLKKNKLRNYHFIEDLNLNKTTLFKDSILVIDIYKKIDFFVTTIIKKFNLKKIIALDNFETDNKYIKVIINGISFVQKKIKSNYSQVYQGLKFLHITNSYKKNMYKIDKKYISFFVSSGGSDKNNLTYAIVKNLLNIKDSKINLLIGPGFKKKDKIFKYKNKKNVIFYKNIKDTKKLIAKNDISIVSGGFTMLESLSLGVPTFVIKNYNHQKYLIRYLLNKKAISYLGDIKNINFLKFNRLVNDTYYLKKLSQNSIKIFRFDGLKNIAQIIYNL
jgi:spore coat polysaccharide biosynthesis predicted glycosyltransferase SpsG